MNRKLVAFCFITFTTAVFLPAPTQAQQKSEIDEKQVEREVNFRSPTRYVVTYNEIDTQLNERRIWVLMDPAKFNLRSLTGIVTFLKEKYPQPNDLDITIHTSLETIETPEEMDLYRDSSDSRFAKVRDKYRRAWFHRDSSGLETLNYTSRLNPYRERMVVLRTPPGK